MLSDHRKGPLPEIWVCNPETTQNLTSTNIYIFAVFCVGRRSRPMTNFKKRSDPGAEVLPGDGTRSGDLAGAAPPLPAPGRAPRSIPGPCGPPQPAGNAHRRGTAALGGQRYPRPSPAGRLCQRRPGPQTQRGWDFEPLGRPRPREAGISPHQRRCDGHDCPGKGSGAHTAQREQRAPGTARSRLPQVPFTV